ncbi:MAG: DUF2283 domain-containing protein [Phycisphaeraceae bacterium]
MVTPDTIEGTIDQAWWFHYDITNDVLYLRLASQREAQTLGEETPDGFILLRHAESDQPVGMTVVSWWKRFGAGKLPDSMGELGRRIEPWIKRIAA